MATETINRERSLEETILPHVMLDFPLKYEGSQPSGYENVNYDFKGTTVTIRRRRERVYRVEPDGSFYYNPSRIPITSESGLCPDEWPTFLKYAEMFKHLRAGMRNFALPGNYPIVKHINGAEPYSLTDSKDGSIELKSIVWFDGYMSDEDAFLGLEHRGWGNKQETESLLSIHWVPRIGILHEVHRGESHIIASELKQARDLFSTPLRAYAKAEYEKFQRMGVRRIQMNGFDIHPIESVVFSEAA